VAYFHKLFSSKAYLSCLENWELLGIAGWPEKRIRIVDKLGGRNKTIVWTDGLGDEKTGIGLLISLKTIGWHVTQVSNVHWVKQTKQ